MLRAILFDFDGTIADTEPLHLDAFRRVLGSRGIAIGEREYYERYLAGTDRECLEQMLDDYRRPDLRPALEELHREKLAVMDQLLSDGVRLFPGFREFVGEAAGAGPLAIVTGAVVSQVKAALRGCGLESCFAVLVGAEDVRRGKPDPEGYLLGYARLRNSALSD
ncbi:MAG: HAD family hydrolase, partial [Candidatus Binatia bacterium]